MKNDIKEMMKIYYETTKLPISLIDNNGVIVHQLGIENEYDIQNKLPISNIFEKEQYIFMIEKNIYTMSLKITENYIITVGPFKYNTSERYDKNNEKIRLHTINPNNIHSYLKLVEIMFKEEKLTKNIKSFDNVELVEKNIVDYRGIDFNHHDYYYEYNILSQLFKAGDEKLLKIGLSNIDLQSGYTSENELRQVKNMHIVTIGLLTRKAIELGLECHYALTISDTYIRLIEDVDKIEGLNMIINNCFKELYNSIQRATNSKYCKIVNEALNFIDRNLSNKISLKEVAQYLNLDSSYLSRLIKKETKITFTEHLLNRRLKESKRLLKYTKYNISEIAFIVGFTSTSYFIKCFKVEEGQSPTVYRESISKKGEGSA